MNAKPMSHEKIEVYLRNGHVSSCECSRCCLLATVDLLRAEVVAARGRLWGDGQAISHSREIERIEYSKARELTDASGILPPTSTPPR